MLLAAQLAQVGFDRIPPVTLATIIAQVTIFLGVWRRFNIRLPTIRDACVSVFSVWYQGQWTRLFWAAYLHVDEWHLYYNMASFLWKGLSLERRMGSPKFLYVIAVFAVLINSLLVGLNMLAVEVLEDGHYYTSCAVGFSGVLFALKVLTTYDLPPGHKTSVMGLFVVPTKLACWVELAITSLLFPNVSFVGHLAGILVGLLYVKGPLHDLMHGTFTGPFGNRNSMQSESYQYRQHYSSTPRTTGGGLSGDDRPEVQAAIAASLRASQGGHLRPLSTRRSRPVRNEQTRSFSEDVDDDPELQQAIRQSLNVHEEGRQSVFMF
jgi:rhomboid domain-containing protein 1